MFSSDLKFRILDEGFYLPEIPMKLEDSLQRLKGKLFVLKSIYRNKFTELVEKYLPTDPDAELHLAVGLYLTTYFDANKSSVSYYRKNKTDPGFFSFI